MSIKKCVNGSFVNDFYKEYGTDTDTITSLPKTIIGDGQPISSYTIKGNMTQSGTPTPSNPVYPTEVGEKTANLYFKSIASVSIDASGKLIGNSQFICYVAKVEANKSYIGQVGYVYAFFDNEPVAGSQAYDRQRVVANASDGITSPIDGYVAVRCNTGATDVMLNEGTTILPYQPYGYKIPILSGGTTTNVYLGEVQSTRQIKKYEFTGNETFYASSQTSVFYTTQISADCNKSTTYNTGCIVNAYKIRKQSTAANLLDGEFTTDSNGYLWFRNYDYTTLTDFKAYLDAQYANGTPVTVWYVLSTATTDIVNEPIRKIGNYADSVSVTGIPTTGTAESFDIDTELKPSEVDLTYHGWHEHSDTKFTG